MSPEQVRARGDVDHRTDIYSCAVMLYEMITGGVPFGGEGYSQIIASIIEDAFPDPRQMWPNLPPPVVDLARWGMEKDPAKRPQSAAEFRSRILEVRGALPDARPVLVHKKTPAYVSTKMSSMVVSPAAQGGRGRAGKALYIVGALVAVMLIAGGVLLTVFSGGWSKKQQPSTDGVKVLAHAIHFTIKADGFLDKEVEIMPSKDMKVDGELEPAPAEKPKKVEKKKKKTEGGSTETKKKGLGHVWDYP